MATRSKDKQSPTMAWQPIAIVVLLVLLIIFMLMLTMCSGSTDSVDHAALGDYIHAVEPTDLVLENREVTGGDGAAVHDVDGTATRATMRILDEGRTTQDTLGTMSFAAFGDVVVGNTMISLADAWADSEGDGVYGFTPLFTNLGSVISTYDVAAVGEVGCLGGYEGKGYAGWPQYNTPDELASSLASAGFRVVNTNTGHLLDWGLESATHAQGIWNAQTSLLAVGSYESVADEEIVRVVECNGVRVAFLSYSTQQAAVAVAADVPSYTAPLASEQSIREGVERAYTVADAVIVFMHWGDDATHVVNDEQRSLAQACADAGATAVIGCGSREIQSVEWVAGANGSNCLVAYGLGALASCYTTSDEILSGMLSFDVTLRDSGKAEISNVVFHPLVEHRSGANDSVYLLRNYSSELASANELLANEINPYDHMLELVSSTIGANISTDV